MFFSGQEALQRARLLSGDVTFTNKRTVTSDDILEENKLEIINWIYKRAFYAGVDLKTINNWIKLYSLGTVVLLLAAIFLKNIFLLLPLIIAPMAVYLNLSFKTRKRTREFEKDYAPLLISLASSIRTGLDPLVALVQAKALFPQSSEVTKALEIFSTKIEAGITEEKAIRGFADDINHPDIELFRVAFLLARREGSSLGECLHRLAKVTRQRQSFRRKMRSAVAMQKLSAWGISGCAVVIGLVQYVTNPKSLSEAFSHPVGFKILIAGVTLIVMGLFWMLHMARAKV